jgi:hypothetical protein
MRQTSSYARVRKGRCSVFWGDQIFVPSCGIAPSSYPADILAALRPMPTQAEWEADELHQYGLIAVDSKGAATQLEKVTYDVATAYLPADVERVGTSLGSFSLSAPLMEALLAEFAPELEGKTASLDSDPHFWMPLTLNQADYVAVMTKKGTSVEEATAHFSRMADFRARFDPTGTRCAPSSVSTRTASKSRRSRTRRRSTRARSCSSARWAAVRSARAACSSTSARRR